MGSWALKVAGGFLAALLLTGSGFPLLGTLKPRAARTGSEPRRARSPADSALGLHHHQRHQRHVARNNCAPDDPAALPKHCCQKCPAGQFMTAPCTSRGNDTTCERCPPGTYLSLENLERECRKCSECHAPASQLVLKNCTETSNIECGCGAGYFRQCTDSVCSDFTCQECRRCKGRDTRQTCSEKEDAQCGDCQPGFYLEGSECRACATQSPEKCGEGCGRPCGGSSQGSGLQYILLGLMGPLFLGALVIYHKRRTLSNDSPAAGEAAAVKDSTLQQASACPSGAAEKPLESQGLLQLQLMEASQMNGNACPVRPLGGQDTWASPTEPQDTASKPRTAERCLGPRHIRPPWLLATIPAPHPGHGGWHRHIRQLSTGAPSAPPSLQAALLLADALFRCPAGPLPGVLPQGSKLYDIINTVPVRRWKEFMRVLELHDGEIEVVELEFAHVRDQQYEMLKRWYQQKNATLDSIFSALERMELAGCAEELRQRLQRCP
ncbi:tumor necrosis factor receptor superfamily member 25 isoform X2 [Mauremys reevesii]|uniref:tumor necrosis factor receptor superfamily member 25 isoform X2 n=1 Tax=Mauremys reevesii TaxID=260615 RepID=UPI00193FC0E7|nr:tumor necrosis factor receptor superfamily member 25 isoform X2 [Mauremys reevesii]